MTSTLNPLQRLVQELKDPYAYPLFVTGAGISVASGIAPFRGSDPGAVWNKDVLEMGTFRYFQEKPVEQWQWYLDRFGACRTAGPNPGHTAISQIEQTMMNSGRRCVTLTQNVDGLHALAGTKNLIEVHGSARHLRCSRRGCVYGQPKGSLPGTLLCSTLSRRRLPRRISPSARCVDLS